MPERAPEAGAPRGTSSRNRRAQSLAERKRPASAAAPVPQRPRVASVEAVDLVVEGGERLLLDGLHGDLVRAAAQLREGRPALAAFLQHLPVLEMPDVGHRLLRHALDLALLLARSVGLDREDAVHLGAQAHVLQDPGGEGLVAELAQLAHHLDGLGARRCRERVSGSLDLPATSKRAAPFRFASAMAWRVLQLEDLHHHGVGVREEQPHLREEPPHVEVVILLHHELGELQRAGTDLGGHTHAGLAAVRLERLHEGQEPLRVVDLELEVRHGALAHGPLELGRVHVGVRVPEPVSSSELYAGRARKNGTCLFPVPNSTRAGQARGISYMSFFFLAASSISSRAACRQRISGSLQGFSAQSSTCAAAARVSSRKSPLVSALRCASEGSGASQSNVCAQRSSPGSLVITRHLVR